MNIEDNEIHVCVYCGKEAHHQFKNGKWCCSKNKMGCPGARNKVSIGLTNYHKNPKDKIDLYPDKGEHICVYCGKYAEYKLRSGKWCCCKSYNQCPAIREKNSKGLQNAHNRGLYDNWINRERNGEIWNKNLTLETSKSLQKASKTLRNRYKSGELKGSWIGKKHTQDQKDKIRISTVNHYLKYGIWGTPRFNPNSCEYIDKLNESKGWNLQHAKNGEEKYVDGFWLDGYDKNLNIAFEYDEPTHYEDVEANLLKDKDIQRMKYIHEKLNCRFFRYNEKMNLLYEVDFGII